MRHNYNQIIGVDVYTDAGKYTIVAHVHDDGNCDQSINLYVGKAADGHYDMIAKDNSSFWVVGSEDDLVLNHSHWSAIADRCSVMEVIGAVQDIDLDLATWLTNLYDDADRLLLVGDRSEYDRYGELKLIRYYPTLHNDIYDAIAECWDDIAVDDVILQGLTCPTIVHLSEVDLRTRTIDGLEDLKADYYVSLYSSEDGDGDCCDWEFYTSDGRHLSKDEAFCV